MIKKTLSVMALLVAVSGCQNDTPVKTWNPPESGSTVADTSLPAEQMPVESNLTMHPSVMGAPVGVYKIGQPYAVDGMDYTPAENYTYQAEGMASWYGSEFAGQKTANGEIFNPQAYTAAHKTLPLPSVVKITNLDNGKATYARVNDRGPFTKNRVIDVSDAVATELEMKSKGTARVRVEAVETESLQLKQMAMANGGSAATTSAPVETGLSSSELSTPSTVVSPAMGYYVQAGALASNANAETMRSQINAVGNTTITHDGEYFKVRVGPFQTMDEALRAKQALQSHGISNPGLIKDGKWSRW